MGLKEGVTPTAPNPRDGTEPQRTNGHCLAWGGGRQPRGTQPLPAPPPSFACPEGGLWRWEGPPGPGTALRKAAPNRAGPEGGSGRAQLPQGARGCPVSSGPPSDRHRRAQNPPGVAQVRPGPNTAEPSERPAPLRARRCPEEKSGTGPATPPIGCRHFAPPPSRAPIGWSHCRSAPTVNTCLCAATPPPPSYWPSAPSLPAKALPFSAAVGRISRYSPPPPAAPIGPRRCQFPRRSPPPACPPFIRRRPPLPARGTAPERVRPPRSHRPSEPPPLHAPPAKTRPQRAGAANPAARMRPPSPPQLPPPPPYAAHALSAVHLGRCRAGGPRSPPTPGVTADVARRAAQCSPTSAGPAAGQR